MLKTRVITAVFLFTIFFLALFYLPPAGWATFVTLVAAVAAWEWGALMKLRNNSSRIFIGIALALICGVVSALYPAAIGIGAAQPDAAWGLGRWFYIPAAAFWLLVVPLWMSRRWPLPNSLSGLLIGGLLILPAWLALIQLRQAGALALLAIMAVVWLADIGAYVFGRTFGKHKLAPSISPGKTWEGVIGGGLVVLVYGFVLSSKLPSALSASDGLLLLVLILLVAISVVGDLFESMLKRQAGLKDSSNVLPGHGGVLDRIDSLTSTLPLVALVWLRMPP
jgi:phosphatidate cytidylyltransferase